MNPSHNLSIARDCETPGDAGFKS